jgi:branched-chain amino acid transport system permease protein
LDVLLAQTILSGILLGGLYVVISIGLSFAFGVMHLINVAQGDLVMLGAFGAFWIFTILGVDPFLSSPIIFLIFFGLGYVLQRTLVHRVIWGPPLMNLVLFFGLSLLVANSALLTWGPFTRTVTTGLSGAGTNLVGATIPTVRLGTFAVALAVVIILFLFLARTRTGMGIVATAQDREAARLMGVNVERVFAITLGIGFGTAGVAGALISPIVSIYPSMGTTFTLFAFLITVFGGMGYLPGTLVGGLFLGLVQSFVVTYYDVHAVYLVLFFVLYLVLMVRPKGIFGRGM